MPLWPVRVMYQRFGSTPNWKALEISGSPIKKEAMISGCIASTRLSEFAHSIPGIVMLHGAT